MRFAQELPAVLALKTSRPVRVFVVLSKQDPSMEFIERNKHLIQHLEIQSSAYENLSSTSERYKVISNIMANSTLTTLYLYNNSIGDNGAQALSEALKTNSTLTTLDLYKSLIGDNGAQALSEALKTNSTVTTTGIVFH
ncbi:hypothetical protein BKA57DRAFT_434545 [Linnemannia elongata]|nr:hypothetical protein BKA57DRAFT_434545 [Linnemannia elongata]